jgi:hypothetical protein
MNPSIPGTLHRRAAASSLAAAVLFVVLLLMSVVCGVSQQWFEIARAPDLYAEALRGADGVLRALVAVDAVFIGCYVVSGVLLGEILSRGRWSPLPLMVVAGSIAAGVLDLIENQHILAMLASAREGLPPSQAALEERMTYSSLKWLLAHGSFFVAGILIDGRAPVVRLFRFALLAVQLPVGVAVWTLIAPGPHLLAEILRALNLAVGFVAVAWLVRLPHLLFDADASESGSGAPG